MIIEAVDMRAADRASPVTHVTEAVRAFARERGSVVRPDGAVTAAAFGEFQLAQCWRDRHGDMPFSRLEIERNGVLSIEYRADG